MAKTVPTNKQRKKMYETPTAPDEDTMMQIALNESMITTARKENTSILMKGSSHESPNNDSAEMLSEEFFAKYEPINAEER